MQNIKAIRGRAHGGVKYSPQREKSIFINRHFHHYRHLHVISDKSDGSDAPRKTFLSGRLDARLRSLWKHARHLFSCFAHDAGEGNGEVGEDALRSNRLIY